MNNYFLFIVINLYSSTFKAYSNEIEPSEIIIVSIIIMSGQIPCFCASEWPAINSKISSPLQHVCGTIMGPCSDQ